MDKPNKTDNAEQPAETADTEGGLTAEKPRSRRRKTAQQTQKNFDCTHCNRVRQCLHRRQNCKRHKKAG